jgi:HD superfamily phosphodiesterase
MEMGNQLERIRDYIEYLFQHTPHPHLLYHNLGHTQAVVSHVEELAVHYKLSESDRFIVLAAAWFHDTGHLLGQLKEHEAAGVQLMEVILPGFGLDKVQLDFIAACIMSTSMAASPTTLNEQILCDADTYHLGTTEFLQTDALVWKELELRLNKKIDQQTLRSLQFLQGHRFYTDYCQQLLAVGKEKNILLLKEILEKEQDSWPLTIWQPDKKTNRKRWFAIGKAKVEPMVRHVFPEANRCSESLLV